MPADLTLFRRFQAYDLLGSRVPMAVFLAARRCFRQIKRCWRSELVTIEIEHAQMFTSNQCSFSSYELDL